MEYYKGVIDDTEPDPTGYREPERTTKTSMPWDAPWYSVPMIFGMLVAGVLAISTIWALIGIVGDYLN